MKQFQRLIVTRQMEDFLRLKQAAKSQQVSIAVLIRSSVLRYLDSLPGGDKDDEATATPHQAVRGGNQIA